MRKLLLLALLLYDIIALATRLNNYDYYDIEGNKRHSLLDDRRNWRKKALVKSLDLDHKDWDDRRRHDFDSPRFLDEAEGKLYSDLERQRDLDISAAYRGQRRYEDFEKMGPPGGKSSELGHSSRFIGKEPENKMNCERQHERYEACFAGCAAVTCDNPRERLRPCYPFCESGCVCVHPHVRDDRTHKCVLPEDCTKGLRGIPDLGDDS